MQKSIKDKVLTLLLELSLCQNDEEANQWYKNSRLQSCGNKTAEELVAIGHDDLVISAIKRTADGGYV
ncbi:hypothetical protein [sulfur-oxidizing endosymbiont of Gigantopelta aegis]|uniref:hypothetical protein n=1 Tax=sulfur-oxidizing endosymbiont of Gigantopelta aegis TaxID=2794934 RepID=UPI0018DB0FDD|nr:hypothetical protein [sulfur-oxidizing endosymbiont of Gigantopelta aegis]